MKSTVLAAVVLLLLSGPSFAGTREDLAKEILKYTAIRTMTDQVVAQVLQMQAAQLRKIDIPADRKGEETALHDKIHAKLNEAVKWEKLEADYGKFLVEVYTDEELQAILNFIKSKEGQGIIKKEPIIMGKIMLLMQARIQDVLPEIQKITRDFSESVKKIK
ncbi:MAG: DUF2059 domain-containing protein [Nitrospiraceae bacterium]|nr:DUF2059 domain-containing protein [Nitrospiraceae bacterium]